MMVVVVIGTGLADKYLAICNNKKNQIDSNESSPFTL
jgi:hypothetical protein